MKRPSSYACSALAALLASSGGFSTIETSAVIAGVSVMSATAAPHLQQYLDMAHQTKALGDARVIAISVVRLTVDVGGLGGHQRVRPTLLVGDGELPASEDASTKPWTALPDGGATQSLTAHLVDNSAGYSATGIANRWRGPYIEGLSSDPWGSRYAINVTFLRGGGGQTVMVVSPGPNKIVETPFETIGLRETGDDIIGLVGRAP